MIFMNFFSGQQFIIGTFTRFCGAGYSFLTEHPAPHAVFIFLTQSKPCFGKIRQSAVF